MSFISPVFLFSAQDKVENWLYAMIAYIQVGRIIRHFPDGPQEKAD